MGGNEEEVEEEVVLEEGSRESKLVTRVRTMGAGF